VKLTDKLGATCTYPVYSVLVENTAPRFLAPPTLADKTVHFNSLV